MEPSHPPPLSLPRRSEVAAPGGDAELDLLVSEEAAPRAVGGVRMLRRKPLSRRHFAGDLTLSKEPPRPAPRFQISVEKARHAHEPRGGRQVLPAADPAADPGPTLGFGVVGAGNPGGVSRAPEGAGTELLQRAPCGSNWSKAPVRARKESPLTPPVCPGLHPFQARSSNHVRTGT